MFLIQLILNGTGVKTFIKIIYKVNPIVYLLVILVFGCKKAAKPLRDHEEISIIGKWAAIDVNGDIFPSSQIIFFEDGTVSLINVTSLKCGTFDKIQNNNGVFNWSSSKLDGELNIDIFSPNKSICLNFLLEEGRDSHLLNPTYNFDFQLHASKVNKYIYQQQ